MTIEAMNLSVYTDRKMCILLDHFSYKALGYAAEDSVPRPLRFIRRQIREWQGCSINLEGQNVVGVHRQENVRPA